jgi:hypothetical protein
MTKILCAIVAIVSSPGFRGGDKQIICHRPAPENPFGRSSQTLV